MHEHPYLNGANEETLQLGEVATNEPGIYVTDEEAQRIGRKTGLGVRIEDPILITADSPELISGSRAKSPWSP